MTETDWCSGDREKITTWFRKNEHSLRKLRRFAVAFCYANWEIIPSPKNRDAVKSADLFEEGVISERELIRSRRVAYREAREGIAYTDTDWIARWAAWNACCTVHTAMRGYLKSISAIPLLHDIFGNPFRPVTLDPAWLAWNDGTVVKLAKTIYDDRRWDIMPILGDALEDAACHDAAILDHCRGPGPHVRGCWVVDLILRKA